MKLFNIFYILFLGIILQNLVCILNLQHISTQTSRISSPQYDVASDCHAIPVQHTIFHRKDSLIIGYRESESENTGGRRRKLNPNLNI